MHAPCSSNKKQFDTQAEAEAFSDKNHAQYGGIHQRVYSCDRCPFWHLTTQTEQSNVAPSVIYNIVPPPSEVTGKELYEALITGQTKVKLLSEKYGIPEPTIYSRINKYKQDNGIGYVTRAKRQAVTLDQVTLQRQEAEVRLAELLALEARLIEQRRMKFEFLDGKLTIRKELGEITISLEELNQLYEAMAKETV